MQPAPPAGATGEAGSLDPSFGKDGRVVGGFDGWASAVALQPDGKIVIAGSIDWKPGYPGLGVVRYNPDGTLDRSFGRSGIAVTGILGRDADPAAVVVQPDGEIVVGGRSPAEGEGSRAFALARFDPDGTLDRSFGKKGIVATDFFGGEQAVTDLALQPDGKIVAGGYASRPTSPTAYRFALARYRPDGSLDRSFGDGGKVVTKLVPSPSSISALALQPDGKIVAGGGTRGKLALVRYLPDGTLDPAFGTAGAVLTDFGRYESLSDLVVLPGGTIVAGGATTPRGGGLNARVLALAGYRPDGTLDPTFGSGGKVLTDLPGKQEGVAGLAAQPDGKIVAVGAVIRPAQRPSALMAVARYEGDGDLDAGFGTGGVVITAFRGDSGAADVALQPDGRIVVVGTTVSPRLNEAGYPIWSYFATARYLSR